MTINYFLIIYYTYEQKGEGYIKISKNQMKKIILKDREFNTVQEFLKSCNKSYYDWQKAKKKGYTEQQFFDSYGNWRVENVIPKQEIIVKEEEDKVKEKNEEVKIEIITKPKVKNININSINELIDAINNIDNINTINLIDFENISHSNNLIENYLQDENTVNIFFYNATLYSNDYYRTIKNSISNNFQITTLEIGDQLCDHIITFYLGSLISTFPRYKYNIVSKDSGFMKFIRILRLENIGIIGYGSTYIENKEKRYEYSLCTFIKNNNYIDGKYINASNLRNCLYSFFKQKNKYMTADKYNYTVNKLIELQVLSRYKASCTHDEYFKFNKNAAKKHLDELMSQ